MYELVVKGGWLMMPILLCSIISLAIVVERLWALRRQRVCPSGLVGEIWAWVQNDELDPGRIVSLRASSPLGRVLAAGLASLHESREVMKENIEDTGRHVVAELERYLDTLGTVASITPLLGLLGTVIGMIKVFTAITVSGVGNAAALAGGISEALLTTAAGLSVAIPSLMFYRHLRRRIDLLVIGMEQESLKMVEIIHGERTPENTASKGKER